MKDLDSLIDGAIPAAKPMPTPADPVPTGQAFDPTGTYTREGYAWANDAFWVYEHLGDRMTKATAGSAARWALFSYAKKNMDQFVGQILPKAMTLLEKAREKAGDEDHVVREEQKGIAELKRILTAAIAEAAGELD